MTYAVARAIEKDEVCTVDVLEHFCSPVRPGVSREVRRKFLKACMPSIIAVRRFVSTQLDDQVGDADAQNRMTFVATGDTAFSMHYDSTIACIALVIRKLRIYRMHKRCWMSGLAPRVLVSSLPFPARVGSFSLANGTIVRSIT